MEQTKKMAVSVLSEAGGTVSDFENPKTELVFILFCDSVTIGLSEGHVNV